MNQELRVTIHPLDATAERYGEGRIGPLFLPALRVGPKWSEATLPLTFEQAAARLKDLPRLHVEPDGSFIWVGPGPPPFHFEGQLHDRGERLSHVEINGYGGADEWLSLIEAGGGQRRNLMIQSVQDGTFFAATEEQENHEIRK